MYLSRMSLKILLFGCWMLTPALYAGGLEFELSTAQQYLSDGDRDGAKRALDRAALNMDALVDSEASLEILRQMASQYRRLGANSNAIVVLKRAIKKASKIDNAAVDNLLRELGDSQGNIGDHQGAKRSFLDLLERLKPAQHLDRAQAYSNMLKAEVRASDNNGNIERLVGGFKFELGKLEQTDKTCGLQLQFSGALLQSRHVVRYSDLLENLLDIQQYDSVSERNKIYAVAYLGLLREKQARFSDALRLSRLALRRSIVAFPELVYRWQWHIARIKVGMGKMDQAITDYTQSIQSLADMQEQLLDGSYIAFKERVLPVYSELIALLLQRAETSRNKQEQQQLLAKVQETIEAFNKSEILEYFSNDCVLPTVVTRLDSISDDTAIIYFIVLQEQTVILSKLPDGLHQSITQIERQNLDAMVNGFRASLEGVDYEIDEVQDYAQTLYEVLLAPIAQALSSNNIKRLVFVPSTILRTVPMSALYDGHHYLIEKYEIATTLGLGLTDPTPMKQASPSLLLAGISESVQGFDALPGVISEIAEIKNKIGGDIILNSNFTLADVTEQLAVGKYSLVHLATHGVFESEASNSYLLAYDDKLSLDKLQDIVGNRRFLGEPIDLLVLSACETAAGNERAALGLAGVSLKAGARSTLASLWPISDAGTSKLMIDFYGFLHAGDSKSAALQKAQLKLLSDPIYQHPNLWSPFLLIGNWL